MFNLFNKQPTGTTIVLKLSGLHCSSCSLSIDGELEDLPGVISSKTSYAKQECVIVYDPDKIKLATFIQTITTLGYKIID